MLRLLDFSIALTGLIFIFPVLLILVILGLFDTGVPLFCQERLGKNQRPFTLYKLRSMRENTISVASHLSNPDDITSFGRFLRRTKLDEIPQLLNVLRGDMSIVGPRPGLANQPDLTKARQKLGVFCVLPGITGLAQIKGIDMSMPEFLAKTDALMIKNMSVCNYIRYIGLTFVGNRKSDGIKRIS